jgi:spermidine/putrescine transport system substrate-binding protein
MGIQNADVFDPISLGLLRNGVTNFENLTAAQNTAGISAINDLVQKGVKLQYSAFQQLGSGTEILAQCWGGDIVLTPPQLPAGTPTSVVKFYFPPSGLGSVNSDMWCISKSAQHPVLAHLWMNHLLTLESAIANFREEGYQQPLQTVTLEQLKLAKAADPSILDMVFVTNEMATNGLPNPIPTAAQLKLYEQAMAQFTA